MSVLPWNASAEIIRPGGEATQVGTLLGCVRAWAALSPEKQGDAHIVCGDSVFHDDWKIASREIGPARIPQLFALL